jgi:hypothetical protein
MKDFSMIIPVRARGSLLETSLGFADFEEYTEEDE